MQTDGQGEQRARYLVAMEAVAEASDRMIEALRDAQHARGIVREHSFPAVAELYTVSGRDAQGRYIISAYQNNPGADTVNVDASLGRYGCMLETELGKVDESVEARLDVLLSHLGEDT